MQAVLCYIHDPDRYKKVFFNSTWNAGLPGPCGSATHDGELRQIFLNAIEDVNFFDRVQIWKLNK